MERNKILITGGSGFIGTNLVQYYLTKGYDVLSLDISAPKDSDHIKYWKQVDILDRFALKEVIGIFSPNYVIHLAARTDLNEKKNIDGYSMNYQGTENLIQALKNSKSLKRAIFASSMLVCKVGHIPKHYDDYAPSTLYGQSKIMMEKIIKNSNILAVPWIIVRPTSIWGPWFDDPYINLFKYIKEKRYFLIADKSCTKTCGYVGNSVWQIDKLLFADKKDVDGKTFYLGDKPAYNMSEWAQEIAQEFNGTKLRKYPYSFFKFLAVTGDVLQKIGLNFPMTSFRLKNMTTDNIVRLDDLYRITGHPPHSRVEGIKATIKYLYPNFRHKI